MLRWFFWNNSLWNCWQEAIYRNKIKYFDKKAALVDYVKVGFKENTSAVKHKYALKLKIKYQEISQKKIDILEFNIKMNTRG